MKMTQNSQFAVGDKVRRAPGVPGNPTHRRNVVADIYGRRIPGVGGKAGVHLSINTDYEVVSILPNGGLILKDFLLPVSARDVVKVS